MDLTGTFLTEEQNWGEKALHVIKSYGSNVGMSDFALVLGGFTGSNTHKTSDGQRAGHVWTASVDRSISGNGGVRTITSFGTKSDHSPQWRLLGARPALSPAETAKILKSGAAKFTRKIGDLQVVEYGAYPQTVAPANIAIELESAFTEGRLKSKSTGNQYTFDSEKHDAFDKPFRGEVVPSYEYGGKHYVRVEARRPFVYTALLSDGSQPKSGQFVWEAVEPVEWLVDPEGWWVQRQATYLTQFDNKEHYDGNFQGVVANKSLQTYLEEIQQPILAVARAAPTTGTYDVVGQMTGRLAERSTNPEGRHPG